MFGLFAVAVSDRPGGLSYKSTFERIGRHVGRALIAFDCAADWHRDRQRGEFNPLPDESAVERALEFCWHQLSDSADLARVRFGHRSRAATTASRVADRIANFRPSGLRTCPTRPNRWAILKSATQRSWLALTTGQLALAGLRASTEDDERPTYAEAPATDLPKPTDADAWRRAKQKSEDTEGPIPAQKRQDCCENTCMAGLCAEGGCEVCCCCLACA